MHPNALSFLSPTSVKTNIQLHFMRVLILCTGNNCCSQMVHGFLQSFNRGFEVHSARTKLAGRVNPKAIEVMSEVGIDLSNHKPKA